MRAAVGDKIVVRNRRDELPAEGENLGVEGDDGGPPYLVCWDSDGHQGLFFPPGDAVVKHPGKIARPRSRGVHP